MIDLTAYENSDGSGLRLPVGAIRLDEINTRVELARNAYPTEFANVLKVALSYDESVLMEGSYCSVYAYVYIETKFGPTTIDQQLKIVHLLAVYGLGHRYGHNIQFVPEGWMGCDWGVPIDIKQPGGGTLFWLAGVGPRNATARQARITMSPALHRAVKHARIRRYQLALSIPNRLYEIRVANKAAAERLRSSMEVVRVRDALMAK